MPVKKFLTAALSLCLLAGAALPAYAQETAVLSPPGAPVTEGRTESPGPADPYALEAPAPGTAVLAVPAAQADIVDSGTLNQGKITWTLDSEGTLTVSGEGWLYDAASSGRSPWMNMDVRRAVIKSGVTVLSPHIFYGCKALASVQLADTVTEISSDAFQNCVSLKEIDIPASVTRFDQRPFEGCTSLERITVDPENPNFYSDAGVLVQREGVDWYNTKPSARLVCCPAAYPNDSYQIPEHVTRIDQNAFEGCKNLASILVSDHVAYIEPNAFRGCTALTSVTLSANVTDFDSTIFQDCPNLAEVHFSPGNPVYSSRDGLVLENRDGETTLVYCPGAFHRNNYRIPDGISRIDSEAFKGCTGLTGSLTIPGGVKTIGFSAFEDCTGLSGSLTLENGVESVDVYAFCGCTGLTSVSIPASTASIGSWTFARSGVARFTVDSGSGAYCDIDGVLFSKDRTRLICCPSQYPFRECFYEIPGGVTSIDTAAFQGCYGLTRVAVPASVREIGYVGLSGGENTTSILYAGSEVQWNQIVTNDGGEWLDEAVANGFLKIYYAGRHPAFYELNIAGSHAEPTGAGWYPAGIRIHFQAGEWPGHRFSGWTITGAETWDPSNPIASFTMPAGPVTAVANWGDAPLTYAMGAHSELTLEREGNRLTVTGPVNARQPLWIAGYGGDGRMRSLLPVAQSGASCQLPAGAAKYKLFWLNADYTPTCESLTLT